MPAMILCLLRFVRLLCSGHQSIVIENAALRLQLRAFQRTQRRPVLTDADRLFWCALAKVWSAWRSALMFVQPETVVRWQRERFRRFWARLSKPKGLRKGVSLRSLLKATVGAIDGESQLKQVRQRWRRA